MRSLLRGLVLSVPLGLAITFLPGLIALLPESEYVLAVAVSMAAIASALLVARKELKDAFLGPAALAGRPRSVSELVRALLGVGFAVIPLILVACVPAALVVLLIFALASGNAGPALVAFISSAVIGISMHYYYRNNELFQSVPAIVVFYLAFVGGTMGIVTGLYPS